MIGILQVMDNSICVDNARHPGGQLHNLAVPTHGLIVPAAAEAMLGQHQSRCHLLCMQHLTCRVTAICLV